MVKLGRSRTPPNPDYLATVNLHRDIWYLSTTRHREIFCGFKSEVCRDESQSEETPQVLAPSTATICKKRIVFVFHIEQPWSRRCTSCPSRPMGPVVSIISRVPLQTPSLLRRPKILYSLRNHNRPHDGACCRSFRIRLCQTWATVVVDRRNEWFGFATLCFCFIPRATTTVLLFSSHHPDIHDSSCLVRVQLRSAFESKNIC